MKPPGEGDLKEALTLPVDASSERSEPHFKGASLRSKQVCEALLIKNAGP
jgi:hypothetical protein